MAQKIVTLSTTDPEAAKTELREWLGKHKILFIVLGDTDIALETVRRAGNRVGEDITKPQWVIHAPKREDVVTILDTLNDPTNLVSDWEKPLAIGVSFSDTFRDVIERDGTIPTNRRIFESLRLAEVGP